MAKFRILSLDGGGIRGAFGSALVAELERRLGAPLAKYFDLIAGTSTGAIIASALAGGLTGDSVVRFYDQWGPKIFSPRPVHQPGGLKGLFYPLLRRVLDRRAQLSIDDLFRAKFCPHALSESFETAFGDLAIGQVVNARLVVPTVDLTNSQTHVFRTPHLPDHLEDRELTIRDLLLAATAAPTYFPHMEIPDGSVHVDGGLFAINPSLIAFAEALKIRQLCTREVCDPTYDTSDIHILSIGTGRVNFSMEPPGADAGQLYWAAKVAGVMGSAQTQGVQSQLEFVLGNRYHRVNFDLPDSTWSLDCVQHLPKLFELGKAEADAVYDSISPTFFDSPVEKFHPFS